MHTKRSKNTQETTKDDSNNNKAKNNNVDSKNHKIIIGEIKLLKAKKSTRPQLDQLKNCKVRKTKNLDKSKKPNIEKSVIFKKPDFIKAFKQFFRLGFSYFLIQ